MKNSKKIKQLKEEIGILQRMIESANSAIEDQEEQFEALMDYLNVMCDVGRTRYEIIKFKKKKK